ncbi:unnamed protein product [Acanthoscelides obtectus]|uniref:Uncharacterized protein n=1 Tax=Acanthoscelides obtectus TaxID=200917 RepID=A0A9P0PBP0_ACAOB|nr:unnamed protein product [Acanthoscelides obtectus]CAK1685806.1 hypothetical protein AOBTE_LOCUS35630 [Acanthoscelides obtectus]
MQLAVMSLTHSVRAIFLIIGNCIIRITSRKFISKLLLRLPSQLFPRYRVVVSGVIIQDNLQRRSMKYPPDVYNSSSSDEDDDESSTVTGKCKCCVLQKAYYHSNIDYSNDNADECVKEDPEFYKYASDIEFPEQNFVESTDGYTEVFEKNFIVKHSFVPGTPCTPPLRRITASELASVQLRPSKDFQRTPRTPEVSDMLNILRRRYAVLHYSPPSSNNSFSDFSECEHRDINSHCGNGYVDCVY